MKAQNALEHLYSIKNLNTKNYERETVLWSINHSFQFMLSVDVLRVYPVIIQITNEDVKQYWSHHPALGHTTGYWSLAGLRATDHNNLLSLSVQPASSIPQHQLL